MKYTIRKVRHKLRHLNKYYGGHVISINLKGSWCNLWNNIVAWFKITNNKSLERYTHSTRTISSSPNADLLLLLPLIISSISTPKLYTSAFFVSWPKSAYSGARYPLQIHRVVSEEAQKITRDCKLAYHFKHFLLSFSKQSHVWWDPLNLWLSEHEKIWIHSTYISWSHSPLLPLTTWLHSYRFDFTLQQNLVFLLNNNYYKLHYEFSMLTSIQNEIPVPFPW